MNVSLSRSAGTCRSSSRVKYKSCVHAAASMFLERIRMRILWISYMNVREAHLQFRSCPEISLFPVFGDGKIHKRLNPQVFWLRRDTSREHQQALSDLCEAKVEWCVFRKAEWVEAYWLSHRKSRSVNVYGLPARSNRSCQSAGICRPVRRLMMNACLCLRRRLSWHCPHSRWISFEWRLSNIVTGVDS